MDRADAAAGEHGFQRLGDHGHVDDDAVALFHTFGFQSSGEAGDAVLQFGIGDDVLGAGDGAVMDDGGLAAAPGEDVAVHRVPAGVDAGIGEPFVERRAAGVERAAGAFHPVDGAGGVEPEPIGIGLPFRIEFTVCHCMPSSTSWGLLRDGGCCAQCCYRKQGAGAAICLQIIASVVCKFLQIRGCFADGSEAGRGLQSHRRLKGRMGRIAHPTGWGARDGPDGPSYRLVWWLSCNA